MGPGKSSTNIDGIYMQDESVSLNPIDILHRWKEEYSKLFSNSRINADLDFIENLDKLKKHFKREYEKLDDIRDEPRNIYDISELNKPIYFEENKRALMIKKNGKAVGVHN